jgi:hypothetical protein
MMSVKRKKTINIRNPTLRKIRDNLRALIITTSRDSQHKIYDEIEKLKTTSKSNNNNDFLKDLYNREKIIEDALTASILLCPVCFKSDKDMTYNPVRKTWYCTDCYEVLQKGNIERGTPEEFP